MLLYYRHCCLKLLKVTADFVVHVPKVQVQILLEFSFDLWLSSDICYLVTSF
jgi:hypothetical protein